MRFAGNEESFSFSSGLAELKLKLETETVYAPKLEVHGDVGVDFHRLAVEHVRLVLPLFHRVHRGSGQHGMAADDAHAFHLSVLADHGLQHHRALDVRASRHALDTRA